MLSTPLIWFSRGAATVCSSVAAEAPGYTARTVTTGGAISGYCAIGSTRIAASPAMTMKIESTAAKIGRSMKKREIMAGCLYFLLWRCLLVRRRFHAFGRLLARGAALLVRRTTLLVGGCARAVVDLHRDTRRHQRKLHHAVDDE